MFGSASLAEAVTTEGRMAIRKRKKARAKAKHRANARVKRRR
jgi:hypothetical protein